MQGVGLHSTIQSPRLHTVEYERPEHVQQVLNNDFRPQGTESIEAKLHTLFARNQNIFAAARGYEGGDQTFAEMSVFLQSPMVLTAHKTTTTGCKCYETNMDTGEGRDISIREFCNRIDAILNDDNTPVKHIFTTPLNPVNTMHPPVPLPDSPPAPAASNYYNITWQELAGARTLLPDPHAQPLPSAPRMAVRRQMNIEAELNATMDRWNTQANPVQQTPSSGNSIDSDDRAEDSWPR